MLRWDFNRFSINSCVNRKLGNKQKKDLHAGKNRLFYSRGRKYFRLFFAYYLSARLNGILRKIIWAKIIIIIVRDRAINKSLMLNMPKATVLSAFNW